MAENKGHVAHTGTRKQHRLLYGGVLLFLLVQVIIYYWLTKALE